MDEGLTRSLASDDWDRRGLPGWAYHSEALLALEKRELFVNHWQIACHESDLPLPGAYVSLDLLGERALVLRGQDGAVRAFHNLCRHRGSRVVTEAQGRCRAALVCPFHGWVYNLDGTLRGAARPESFAALDKANFQLKPIECCLWHGLVFIRFSPGPQPPVAELLAPIEADIADYGLARMQPGGGIWTQTTPVNWKSVRDVDNEGYHVAMAHPALQDLYGPDYRDEPWQQGLARSVGPFNPAAGRRWSVRQYLRLAGRSDRVPDRLRRCWTYYGIFPNAVIAATPESVQFYQEFPLSSGQTLLRGAIYRHAEESRAERLARYLALRIDRETMAEDVQLTIWSNEAMRSEAFEGFYLSDLERGVRGYHDLLRERLPVLRCAARPSETRLAEMNEELCRGQAGSGTRATGPSAVK